MKSTRHLLVTALFLALSLGAIAQSRINTINHNPNPAYNGNAVTALLNVNLWNFCEYFNTAHVFPNGYTINVYLDFNTAPGNCIQAVYSADISVLLGSLAAGYYTVNFYDWDSNAYLRSYYLTVSNGGGSISCSNPVQMSCGSSYNGNNSNGRYSWSSYTSNSGSSVFTNMTGPETIHQFSLSVPSNVTITLSNHVVDLDLMLHTLCSNNGIIAWSGNGNNASEQIVTTLPAGTYRIIVDGYAGAVSNYLLSLNCSSTGCGTPSTSQLSASSITQTTARTTCTASGVLSYQFRIKTTNGSTWTTSSSSTNNYVNWTGMTACTNYEFQCRVYCNTGWSSWSASKIFTTQCQQTCNAPTLSQIYVSNATQTSVQLNCSVLGVLYYAWAYRPLGGAWVTLPNTTTNYTNLAGLSPNTTYEFSVAVYCSNNLWSDWSPNASFTTLPFNNVTNDEPCGATVLYPSYSCNPTYGSNIGATTTYNPPLTGECDEYYQSARDVWFRFIMPSTGKVSFTTFAGSLTDGVIAVYGGLNCNSLSYAGCIDDKGDNRMPYGFITGTPGSTVYLRFWGWGGSVGTFSICLQIASGLDDPGGDKTPGNDEGFALALETDATAERQQGKTKTAEKTDTLQTALKLFPVPARDHLSVSIEMAKAGTFSVEIFDLTGKKVLDLPGLEAAEGTHTESLDISELPNGAFMVKVQTENGIKTGKFTKVD